MLFTYSKNSIIYRIVNLRQYPFFDFFLNSVEKYDIMYSLEFIDLNFNYFY